MSSAASPWRIRLRVSSVLATGMSVREIAEAIGIAKSVVHRMKQKIERAAKEGAAGEDGAR
jgi:transposase